MLICPVAGLERMPSRSVAERLTLSRHTDRHDNVVLVLGATCFRGADLWAAEGCSQERVQRDLRTDWD